MQYTLRKRVEPQRGRATEEPNRLWLYVSDPVHPGALAHLAFYRELAPLFNLAAEFPWETL